MPDPPRCASASRSLLRAASAVSLRLLPAVLTAPSVKRRRADPMLPAQLAGLGPRFTLFQDPDDLFFAEPAVLHSFVFLPQLRCFGKPSLEWLSSLGQGQTGFKGRVIKRTASDRAQVAPEKHLVGIKKELEG